MISFQQAKSEHCAELANLAEIIWRQHFTPVIGEEQVNYMLHNFQSEDAIKKFIEEGYEYFIIKLESKSIGYFAIQNRKDHLHLSKFYILEKFRGQGYGKITLRFICKKASEYKLASLRLVVNKDNSGTIQAYKKWALLKLVHR